MVKNFIKKYIYHKRRYDYGKLLWIYFLGFHFDFRKWYYSILDYEEYQGKWIELAWVPEFLLDLKDREYFKPVPLSWRIADNLVKWKYKNPVRWTAVGYLIARIIYA